MTQNIVTQLLYVSKSYLQLKPQEMKNQSWMLLSSQEPDCRSRTFHKSPPTTWQTFQDYVVNKLKAKKVTSNYFEQLKSASCFKGEGNNALIHQDDN